MLNRPALYGSLIALGVAGAAHAESHDAMAAMSPQTMTCADIAEMDEGQAEGAIYFVAGYENAQGFGSAMGTTGGVTGVTGTAATTETGTTGTATTGTETDRTAGLSAGTGTGTDMGAGSGMGMINFQDIQVSEILSACEESPDQLVSAVLRDHMGGATSN